MQRKKFQQLSQSIFLGSIPAKMEAALCMDDDVFQRQRMREFLPFPDCGRSCRHRTRDKSLFSKSGIPFDGMAVLLWSLVLLVSWAALSNASEDSIDKLVSETQKQMFDSITKSIHKDLTSGHSIVPRSASSDQAPPGGEVPAPPSDTADNTTAASNQSEGAKPEITARSAASDSGNDTTSQNGTDITPRSADGGNSTAGGSNDTAANSTGGAEITARSASGGGNSTASGDNGNSTQPVEIAARSAGGDAPTIVAPSGDNSTTGNGTDAGNSTVAQPPSPTTVAPAA